MRDSLRQTTCCSLLEKTESYFMIIGDHHRLRNRHIEVFFDATSLIELCQEKFGELELRIGVTHLGPFFVKLSGI